MRVENLESAGLVVSAWQEAGEGLEAVPVGEAGEGLLPTLGHHAQQVGVLCSLWRTVM